MTGYSASTSKSSSFHSPDGRLAEARLRTNITTKLMIARCAASLDDLVGAGEQSGRNFKAKGLRCRQINDEIELSRLLDWQVSRLSPAQNLVDKIGSAPELAWPI